MRLSLFVGCRLAYCRLGKVASSTWLRTLKTAVGDSNPSARSSKLFQPAHQLRPRQRRDYFAFMFVRHPFDRLVSAYRNNFASQRTEYWTQVSREGKDLGANLEMRTEGGKRRVPVTEIIIKKSSRIYVFMINFSFR